MLINCLTNSMVYLGLINCVMASNLVCGNVVAGAYYIWEYVLMASMCLPLG